MPNGRLRNLVETTVLIALAIITVSLVHKHGLRKEDIAIAAAIWAMAQLFIRNVKTK